MSANDLFDWSELYRVHIQEIDEQHRVLVSLLNELYEAHHDQRGEAECRSVLDRLAEYTRTHFLLEESLMRLVHYPNFEMHKQQHEDLMHQMQLLQANLDCGQASINLELLHFIKDWLLKHINEMDMGFGLFFQTAGLSDYSTWSNEVQTTMRKKKWWWKFW